MERMMDMEKKLFVEEAGQEHEKTIIFLHATGSSSQMWCHHIVVLKKDFHCIAVDLPGHGKSVKIEWTSFDEVADMIVEIIQAKVHGKPHLVGLSLGASLALKLLERQVDLLDRVIIDGSGHQPIKGYRKIIVTVHLMSFLKNTKLVENLMSKMMQADGVTSQEVQSFIADMQRASRKSFRLAMSQANLLRVNLDIDNPVFFVSGGKESPSIHASHQLLARINSQSECAYYPEKGHAWLFSDVDTHIQLAKYFFQGYSFPEKLKYF